MLKYFCSTYISGLLFKKKANYILLNCLKYEEKWIILIKIEAMSTKITLYSIQLIFF